MIDDVHRQLRERIEYLEAENANLRQVIRNEIEGATIFTVRKRLGITKSCARILVQLLANDSVSYDAIFHELYCNRNDPPEPQVIKVFVTNLRRVLKTHGIYIMTTWGQGYYLTPDMRSKVMGLIGVEA